MRMRRRWRAFCRRAGVSGQEGEAIAEAAFAELDRRYAEPRRHYHTWRHVAACLRELRRARPPADDAQALELSVWFHDAQYEPGRKDNEEASAELALHWSAALGLAPELGRRAAGLILATRHLPPAPRPADQTPAPSAADAAEALLRDIDLAVLGAGRLAFRRYELGIAREYAGQPGFREGRARLLQEFLSRPTLYATPDFRRHLERRARGNLARSVARLTGRSARRSAGPAGRPDPR